MHAWGPHLPSLGNLLGQLQSMVSMRDWGGLTLDATWSAGQVPNPVAHSRGCPFCAVGLSVRIRNLETSKLTTLCHIIGF